MDDHYSENVEQEAWLVLTDLRRTWIGMCDRGEGTPGLREAADGLAASQGVLERERGRRQLREVWYERTPSD